LGLNVKGYYFNNPNPLGPTRNMTPRALSPNKDKILAYGWNINRGFAIGPDLGLGSNKILT